MERVPTIGFYELWAYEGNGWFCLVAAWLVTVAVFVAPYLRDYLFKDERAFVLNRARYGNEQGLLSTVRYSELYGP